MTEMEAVTVGQLIARMLCRYEEESGISGFDAAVRMDIVPSNYYLYRGGHGNPTGRTMDKMIRVVGREFPDILQENWELLKSALAEGGEAPEAQAAAALAYCEYEKV